MDNKYYSRMFLIVAVLVFMSCVGLFMKLLTGGEFTTLALGLPTAFGLKDAALTYIHKSHDPH